MARFQSFYDLDPGLFDAELIGQKRDQGLIGLAVNGRGRQVSFVRPLFLHQRIFPGLGDDFDLKEIVHQGKTISA
jgi:hypothetical protein